MPGTSRRRPSPWPFYGRMFPTHIRSTAVGFCAGSARIVTSFGPLARSWPQNRRNRANVGLYLPTVVRRRDGTNRQVFREVSWPSDVLATQYWFLSATVLPVKNEMGAPMASLLFLRAIRCMQTARRGATRGLRTVDSISHSTFARLVVRRCCGSRAVTPTRLPSR